MVLLTLASAKDEMKRMSEKYSNGYDGFEGAKP